MTVLLVPTSPIPIVEVALAVDAGYAADPAERPGVAVVALAALDQQAERLHATTRWAVGTHSSGADLDSSGILMRGPARDLDLVLDQLDGIVHAAPLDAADLDTPRAKLVKSAASPARALWTQTATLRAARYGANHPYSRAHPPTAVELAAIGVPDVAAFARAHLQPDRTTLIVTGGFDPAAVEPMVHRVFDGWHGTGAAHAHTPAELTASTFARTESRPVVNVAFAFAGDRLDDHYAARLILANMLGSITANGSGHFVQHDLAGGFEYTGNFEPAKAPGSVTAFLAGIDDLERGAPRYLAAFASARSRIARSMWGSTQSASGWEVQLQYAASLGRDLGWLRDLPRRATRVTYEEVVAIARAEPRLERASVVVSGPHDAVDATCKALGRAPTWLD